MSSKNTECSAKDAGTGECSDYKGRIFCKKHHHQYCQGIIDIKGNKIRSLTTRRDRT